MYLYFGYELPWNEQDSTDFVQGGILIILFWSTTNIIGNYLYFTWYILLKQEYF